MPSVLRAHRAKGFLIAVLSNQSGIGRTKEEAERERKLRELQRKVERVVAGIGCPVDFLCALADDGYRKPRRGMWDALVRLRGLTSVDTAGSIYVGDAAGRPARGKRKKDFAASDLLFAMNVGCALRTPESFFMGSSDDLDNAFDASGHLRLIDLAPPPPSPAESSRGLRGSELLSDLGGGVPELVVLVAPAASGKSSLARRMPGHRRVNQDGLGSRRACLETAREALRSGRSVVVDNTNLTRAIRREWLVLAAECGAKVTDSCRTSTS